MSHNFTHFFSKKVIAKYIPFVDNFGLTKSCYWRVSNFSDPWLGAFAAFGGRKIDTEKFSMSSKEKIADLLGTLGRSGTRPPEACSRSGLDSDSLSESMGSSLADSDTIMDRMGTDYTLADSSVKAIL